jgi:pimeloyl-ACP methyl ester carboxylesterase
VADRAPASPTPRWCFRRSSARSPNCTRSPAPPSGSPAAGDWPALYDPAVLERNRVPVAAVAYADDLYVPLAFSQETAARVPNLRLWVTNEFEHDGLRAHGARVFARLQELRVG